MKLNIFDALAAPVELFAIFRGGFSGERLALIARLALQLHVRVSPRSRPLFPPTRSRSIPRAAGASTVMNSVAARYPLEGDLLVALL